MKTHLLNNALMDEQDSFSDNNADGFDDDDNPILDNIEEEEEKIDFLEDLHDL